MHGIHNIACDIFCTDCRKDPENIQAVMKELVAALLPKNFSSDFNEDNEVLCIHVRRTTFLLDDALREGAKKKFVPGKKLKVCRLLFCLYLHVLSDFKVYNSFSRWNLPLRGVWTLEVHDVGSCAFWQWKSGTVTTFKLELQAVFLSVTLLVTRHANCNTCI